MIIRVLFSMLMIVGLLGGGSFVGAQTLDYPTKPIILQVPWPAGGSTDVGARIVASIAEKKMGQPIVVTNRVGAGSQIGLTETARQKPDGYFLGFASLPALNTIILDPERKALFSLNSLVFIINQVIDPGIIWAKGDSPYKTLKDLLDDARKRPGEIRAATTGILGDDHLAILMLEEAAKVKFRIVHFDGGAQVFTATLGVRWTWPSAMSETLAPSSRGPRSASCWSWTPKDRSLFPMFPLPPNWVFRKLFLRPLAVCSAPPVFRRPF